MMVQEQEEILWGNRMVNGMGFFQVMKKPEEKQNHWKIEKFGIVKSV